MYFHVINNEKHGGVPFHVLLDTRLINWLIYQRVRIDVYPHSNSKVFIISPTFEGLSARVAEGAFDIQTENLDIFNRFVFKMQRVL